MKTTIFASLVCAFAITTPSLIAQDSHIAGREILKRTGEPDFAEVQDNDAAMAQAVQKARKTIGKFIEAVRSPQGGQTRFAVKRPFVQGDKVEHIWLRDVTYDGKVFHGVVDNQPDKISSVHLDEKTTAAPGEISDWMYVQNGQLVGGYTVRALCRDLSSAGKRKFCAEAGFQIDDNKH